MADEEVKDEETETVDNESSSNEDTELNDLEEQIGKLEEDIDVNFQINRTKIIRLN
jgi:hypothetical protein